LLVVDHDPDFLRLIKSAAKGLDFDVIVTGDPSTIVKKAEFWRPTVPMIDLRTPGIDGIRLRILAEARCTAHKAPQPPISPGFRGLQEVAA
jgi:CheY-like chemotaxis protein